MCLSKLETDLCLNLRKNNLFLRKNNLFFLFFIYVYHLEALAVTAHGRKGMEWDANNTKFKGGFAVAG